MKLKPIHSFHIPVMGLAYTIDSPVRVAQYGFSSTISVMDDELIERMNKFYCEKFELPYQEITKKIEDFRAKRITAYLNTLDTIVKGKFENLKASFLESKKEVEDYIEMLPSVSEIRKNLQQHLDDKLSIDHLKGLLEHYLAPGDIDVNIMTKVDRENFNKKEALPVEYNDAHAALRGFVNSTLSSSVVLSAGMNPRLFSYFEEFDAFYPAADSTLQKKIILKVSDFRSALIQGNFLAKKGLWVSEYRIESGLNCGGHAFATDGYLMGVILEEFKARKAELIGSTHELLVKALEQKNRFIPSAPLDLKITAQGGVGTAAEHQFLLEHYEVDSVGWGSPFLLVPEATSVDQTTRELLAKAKEEDLYLSNISPLGVLFNSIKGTSNDFFKSERINKNKAGSSCPRKYLALNKNYSNEGLCTASRKYQTIEIEKLEQEKNSISKEEYNKKYQQITEKACLCIGLANASYMELNLPIKGEAQGVAICPGPNIAYFTKEVSLKKMVNHIYGRDNVIETKERPHFFIKELRMYLDHYREEKIALASEHSAPKLKKLMKTKENLLEGITYYKKLFREDNTYFIQEQESILKDLLQIETELLK
ncbi:hypothetical protein HX030_07100 [Myroides odoratimimus]|uniref:hypothetical protein n=1 Tax=Myroides odoratimimus TaxID=76832 RepID=UPI0025765A8A|nr:hypothetical protein [Myroides odoratimimus]MDM1443017.1 hypothetical protein [Myroides odoratimimus]MDM1448465.1 hypothetical protein [Myroides odoratimimus]MDM1453555.1 hypothetical protein [Myroides odoratimimus]MDM1466819.1 hypothetical protein [Myroides odoratimimus]MDM1469687.1 hypothetical protein [Myroides odoratimimus]